MTDVEIDLKTLRVRDERVKQIKKKIKDFVFLGITLGLYIVYLLKVKELSIGFFTPELPNLFTGLCLYLGLLSIFLIFLGMFVENYVGFTIFFASLLLASVFIGKESRFYISFLPLIVAIGLLIFNVRMNEKSSLNPNPYFLARKNLNLFFTIVSLALSYSIYLGIGSGATENKINIPKEVFYSLDPIIEQIPNDNIKNFSMHDSLDKFLNDKIEAEKKKVEEKIVEQCKNDEKCIETAKKMVSSNTSTEKEIESQLKEGFGLSKDANLKSIDFAELFQGKINDFFNKNKENFAIIFLVTVFPIFLSLFWILGIIVGIVSLLIFFILFRLKIVFVEIFEMEKKRYF